MRIVLLWGIRSNLRPYSGWVCVPSGSSSIPGCDYLCKARGFLPWTCVGSVIWVSLFPLDGTWTHGTPLSPSIGHWLLVLLEHGFILRGHPKPGKARLPLVTGLVFCWSCLCGSLSIWEHGGAGLFLGALVLVSVLCVRSEQVTYKDCGQCSSLVYSALSS